MRPQLIGPHMSHSLLGGVPNGFGIILENSEAKEAIVVRRLFFGPNPKPAVIWIEDFGHGLFLPIRCQIKTTHPHPA